MQNAWIDALKSSYILLDLKDEFIIGSVFGCTNNTKLHECIRRDDPEQKKYVLKTMGKDMISKSNINIHNLLQEIEILRALDHPYINRLHEVYESNKYIHLVLSY